MTIIIKRPWVCMKSKEIEIKKSDNNDKTVVKLLKTNKRETEKGMSYWLCLHQGKPIGVIASTPLAQGCPEPFVPWLEGATLWIEFISSESIDPTLGAACLKAFAAEHKGPGALLCDPDVKQAAALALYEAAGFTRVSTFIKGSGFFKGSPHYLLKLKF